MGKYQVSQCIGRGGMAEVFLARQESIGGFEKLVALKRIYPHLIHDESFIEMFLSEARIAASLQHPNVVQILDIQDDEDGLFIVMEYLAGESVFQILKMLSERELTVPPEMVCRIGADVASGLHMAHMASDSEGVPRPVVHRDVTPSNILVSFSGEVKVLDFGVAKAAKRQVTTDKGVLKGKTPYLTPEQIAGESVDARADVFQLGIVLHEMLTGRQLFRGETFPAVMKAITDVDAAPPSAVNSESPEVLDTIVLKALHRDKEKRYQSAEELAHDLDMAARKLGEPVSERALGKWMGETFPARKIEKQQLKTAALDHSDSPPDTKSGPKKEARAHTTQVPTAVERPTGAGKPSASKKSTIVVLASLAAAAALAMVVFRGGGESKSSEESPPTTPAPPVISKVVVPSMDASAPLGAIDAGAATYLLQLSTTPKKAKIEVNGEQVAIGTYSVETADSPVQIRVSAPGFVTQDFQVSRSQLPPALVRLDRVTGRVKHPKQHRPVEKPSETIDKVPTEKTKPFGSDNLNPWDSP